jgi:hypothetical protein
MSPPDVTCCGMCKEHTSLTLEFELLVVKDKKVPEIDNFLNLLFILCLEQKGVNGNFKENY